MNRKDFFRTLFGGAALAAGAKAVASSGLQGGGGLVGGVDVRGSILFDVDLYERIAPGAFNLPENNWRLKGHDSGLCIGQVLEVSHTPDGIGFTYVENKL